MASAFADIMAACGIWLGGRKAAVTAEPVRRQPPGSRGSFHHRRRSRASRFDVDTADPDLITLVRREVERHVQHESRKKAPGQTPAPVNFDALPIEPAEAEVLFSRLFTQPALDAYFAGSREAFRLAAESEAARLAAAREAEIDALIASQRAAMQAVDEDDIAALLTLI